MVNSGILLFQSFKQATMNSAEDKKGSIIYQQTNDNRYWY